jgi:hypothetical protein
MQEAFHDCNGWQSWLDRAGMPPARAAIGLLRREDFAARRGTLLLWSSYPEGCRATLREYSGAAGDDVAVLLVAEAEALDTLLADGVAALAGLVRRGRVHPYMLKTLGELEDAGLAEFVEDLGLVFPKH